MLQFSLLADTVWYPILTDSEPMSVLRFVAFWMTILFAAVFLILALLFRGETQKRFLRVSLFTAIVYAAIVAVLFLALNFAEDGVNVIVFVPLLLLILATAGSALTLYFKRCKLTYIICGCVVGAAAIATLVCMGVYYGNDVNGDGYYNSDVASVDRLALWLCAVGLLAVIAALAFVFGRKDKAAFDSRSIAYAAVCIGMSFALSYVRFFRMPQGGSVTLASLLPLMLYSYMFGTKKGVLAGFAYGMLQAVQDIYIIHPAQFLLDYPIAFAAIGLAGMFSRVKALDKLPQIQFVLGAIVASALRFFSHVLSGVFAFSAYAADAGNSNVWAYSLVYNSFVFVDIAIVLVLGVIVLCSPAVVKAVRKYRPKPSEEA